MEEITPVPPVVEEFPLDEYYRKVWRGRSRKKQFILGRGKYGQVVLYKRKEGVDPEKWPEYVAVKAITNSGKGDSNNDDEGTDEEKDEEDWRLDILRKREIEILERVSKKNNDNIIKYHGFLEKETTTSGETLLVMEACHGTLRDLIKSGRKLSTEELSNMTGQMLNGLSCLHNIGELNDEQALVIHRDFKPENVLIKVQEFSVQETIDWKTILVNSLTLKVSDFGLGRYLPAMRIVTLTGGVGTAGYASPEIANPQKPELVGKYDQKSDIYSLGVTVLELTTGEKQPCSDLTQLWSNPKLKDFKLISFLFATLQSESKLRLDANELKQHPFVIGCDIDNMKFQETINEIHIADRHIIIGGRKGSVFVVDLRSLKNLEIEELQERHTGIMAITHHGEQLAVSGREGRITIWSLKSKGSPVAACVKTIDCHDGKTIRGLLLSQKYLVSMGDDRKIIIHSRGSWTKLGQLDMMSLPHQLENLSFDHEDNRAFVPGAPDQLTQLTQIEMGSISAYHKIILIGNKLLVADADHVKIFTLSAEEGPKLNVDMHIEDTTEIKCICLANEGSDINLPSATGNTHQFLWVGTKNGKILKIDTEKRTVLQEIQVFDKGYVRQIESLGKCLVCCLNKSDARGSIILYELKDMLSCYTSAQSPSVIPFRQIINFGGISSEVHVKGNQHLLWHDGQKFQHFEISDIDKVPKTTELKLDN